MGVFGRSKKQTQGTDDLVIDLRDRSPARGELVWGMPSRCPECGDFGYLDSIDVERLVMHQHCPTCWHRWDLTQEEIETQDVRT
jgi:hypothetical protein